MTTVLRRGIAFLLTLAILVGAGLDYNGLHIGEVSQAEASTQRIARSGYVAVDDLNIYYEIHGQGDPLVLLHGAFFTIDLNFGRMLPELARGRQVIAIEQQAHGHTGDADRPLTYQRMADDTAAVLRALNIQQADILGYSMGGTIAIELGMLYPELVRKLVVISAPFDRDGQYPEVYATIEALTPELFDGSGLPEAHVAIAPTDGWPTLVAKIKELNATFTGRTAEEFRAIKAPTLIMVGDSDRVPLEKVVQMFKLHGGGVFGDIAGLPNSQLAVIPASTHVGITARTEWLLPMITEFLDRPLSQPT
jgi:pimeloyl-ACP methyl ester carboxylesterase